MTIHPHQLFALSFTQADQERLIGFSCGTDAWSRHVSAWITSSDVLDSMKRYRTRVWLFENACRDIVGYGSLGTTKWKWPHPDGDKTTFAIIPMLGVAETFQGQPADPEWRYSKQIMGHLIAEAQAMSSQARTKSSTDLNWLVLQVHSANARAIRFYEACGFELIPDVERISNHSVMKLWIGESPPSPRLDS